MHAPSVTAVTAGCPTDRARSGHGLGLWHHGDVDLQHAPANLRFLLNEWDPIGVADLVQDEYDCLIAPVLKVLISGGGRAGVSELLWYELEDHFGLDPVACEVDLLANRLVAWWAAIEDDL